MKKEVLNLTGKLIYIERMPSSVNGNPRHKYIIGDTVFTTKSDSPYGYSSQNFEGKIVNVELSYHFNKLSLNKIKLASIE